MASNYPTSLDSFTDPLSNSPLNSPSHAGQHQDLNNSVEQLEKKLGTGASNASSASANQVLVANGSGGSSWAAVPEYSLQSGLVYITGTTVGSAVTSVTVSNVFSSTYDNYRIIITGGTASAGDNLSMQLSGSTGSTYNTGGSFTTYGSATLSGYGPAATTTWLIGYVAPTHTAIVTDVFSPQLATPSRMVTASTSTFNYSFTGANTSTVQSTGFTLSITTGTMSSQTIRVYGYRQA